MLEYTKGPWHTAAIESTKSAPWTTSTLIVGPNEEYVADIFGHGAKGTIPWEGNAKLIAQAPTMLDALRLGEEALGENLQWITDQVDLRIRQKDAETLRKLDQLSRAWREMAKALAATTR